MDKKHNGSSVISGIKTFDSVISYLVLWPGSCSKLSYFRRPWSCPFLKRSNLDNVEGQLGLAILPIPYWTEISVPIFGKFKDFNDLNSSFISETNDVTDPDLLNISKISPRLPRFHRFYISRNLMIWHLTLSKISA